MLASSYLTDREPDALPLPTPAADPQPTLASRHPVHEEVWSQPGDVAPELSVLEETLSLLSAARSATGGSAGDLAELDNLLAEAAI